MSGAAARTGNLEKKRKKKYIKCKVQGVIENYTKTKQRRCTNIKIGHIRVIVNQVRDCFLICRIKIGNSCIQNRRTLKQVDGILL